MLHAKAVSLIATVAALALAIPSAAAASAGPNELFNYGQCVRSGFPAPSDGEFGPLVFNVGNQGFVFHNPPGQVDIGRTGLACPVEAGPGQ